MPRYSCLLAAVCLSLSATPALGQTASSSAYTVDVEENVSLLGIVNANVNVGPISPSSGAAPPSYDNSNSVLTLSESASLTTGLLGIQQGLQTGLLTTNANGTATGAEATATINDLSLTLGTNLLLTSLLGLDATTIQSYSQANSVGGLDASGSTTIEGLVFAGSLLGGLNLDGSLFINPDPNTVLLSIAGLSILLNEQIMLGDGVTGIGISTNAIHIGFDNFLLGTNLLNGDIILGHSEAFASVGQPGTPGAVPEPGTWAMMLLGFGAVGFAMRRSKGLQPMRQAA